ncbi:hypothetical protein [Burkholderia ambifaria]|uniref:hypothetical protein n=2 Tax=Burkholderia ambifaria TaxID=152480 RepID=UPI00158BEFBF|nr:hypothetical protein [Burkholderia ambifaria]
MAMDEWNGFDPERINYAWCRYRFTNTPWIFSIHISARGMPAAKETRRAKGKRGEAAFLNAEFDEKRYRNESSARGIGGGGSLSFQEGNVARDNGAIAHSMIV